MLSEGTNDRSAFFREYEWNGEKIVVQYVHDDTFDRIGLFEGYLITFYRSSNQGFWPWRFDMESFAALGMPGDGWTVIQDPWDAPGDFDEASRQDTPLAHLGGSKLKSGEFDALLDQAIVDWRAGPQPGRFELWIEGDGWPNRIARGVKKVSFAILAVVYLLGWLIGAALFLMVVLAMLWAFLNWGPAEY